MTCLKLNTLQASGDSVNLCALFIKGNNPMSSTPEEQTAQKIFDGKYITAADICKIIDVSRTALKYAMDRGDIPKPIHVSRNSLMIWERITIQPYIEAWKENLEARRNRLAR